ncbi:MAG: hypothetical protein R3A49_09140 [Acidimicrobiia bacterium]
MGPPEKQPSEPAGDQAAERAVPPDMTATDTPTSDPAPDIPEVEKKAEARIGLPEGTLTVGGGLITAGLAAYGFIVVSARALGTEETGGLSGLWALIFILGPGFFLPLEQEVARALADRRARGLGGGPLVKRAVALGSVVAGTLAVAALVFSTLLLHSLLDGSVMLLVGLIIGIFAFYAQHLTRGTLSGNGRFGAYGLLLGSEGVLRLLGCIALAVIGVGFAGPYGLVLGLAPAAATLLALRGQHGLVTDGPEAPWSELSTHLGWLLCGSVLAQTLAYAAIVAVNLLATDAEADAAGQFFTASLVTRIPILLFQAVQAALLPKLAGLAGAGKHVEFKAGLRQLLLLVVGVTVLGVGASYAIGPWAVGVLFGEEFAETLGRSDLALLALGSCLFIAAMTLAQALIALVRHSHAAYGWMAGVVVFVIVTALVDGLFLRAELGFVCGAAVAVAVMGAFVIARLRSYAPKSSRALVEVLEHEPLEL